MEYLSCVSQGRRAKSTKENISPNVNFTLNLYSAGMDRNNKEFMGFLSTAQQQYLSVKHSKQCNSVTLQLVKCFLSSFNFLMLLYTDILIFKSKFSLVFVTGKYRWYINQSIQNLELQFRAKSHRAQWKHFRNLLQNLGGVIGLPDL